MLSKLKQITKYNSNEIKQTIQLRDSIKVNSNGIYSRSIIKNIEKIETQMILLNA